ncbi:Ditrans,polycis-polyprenyl diphosphate synthase ((2E,6E)-farnesyl diphosphate specific) [Bertholletia excelsa]
MLSVQFCLPPSRITPFPSPHHRSLSPMPLPLRYNRCRFKSNPDPSGILCATAQDVVDGVPGALTREQPLPVGLRRELSPEHVAVVMDGNRRWARMRGLPVGSGYEAGVRARRGLLELCCRWGSRVLTVFAFSSDNWFRPKVCFLFLYVCLYINAY